MLTMSEGKCMRHVREDTKNKSDAKFLIDKTGLRPSSSGSKPGLSSLLHDLEAHDR